LGPEAYPKCALEYLNDWAAPDKGWLRKFYKPGTDQAQFDLTPATEKAIAWLLTLIERPFVGTESRLLMLFALLEQISAGTEADPIKRVDDLRRKREELDAEIARVLAGDMPLLDDTAVKDRFQQFQQLARELLADFREVENNFRLLDRKVRERIALWEGAKGALLDEIMGERDAIGCVRWGLGAPHGRGGGRLRRPQIRSLPAQAATGAGARGIWLVGRAATQQVATRPIKDYIQS
jgi:hypothetical protein